MILSPDLGGLAAGSLLAQQPGAGSPAPPTFPSQPMPDVGAIQPDSGQPPVNPVTGASATPFWQKLVNGLAGVTPSQSALLTPQDKLAALFNTISKAGWAMSGANLAPGVHRSFGAAVGQALSGMPANFQGQIQQTLQNQQEGMVQQQMAAAQAIPMHFQPTPGETDIQARDRMVNMGNAYLQAGMPDFANRAFQAAKLYDERTTTAHQVMSDADRATFEAKFPALPDGSTPEQQRMYATKAAQWLATHGYTEIAQRIISAGQLNAGAVNPEKVRQFNITSAGLAEARQISKEKGISTEEALFQRAPDVQQYVSQASKFQQLYSVLDQAEHANPTAYKSLTGNLAQTLDQKGQLRTTLFQIFAQLDPSLTGQLDAWVQKMKDGTFPKEQLANVRKLVDAVRAGTVDAYDAQRQEFESENSWTKGRLRPGEVIFPYGASPSVNAAGQPIPQPKRGQKASPYVLPPPPPVQ